MLSKSSWAKNIVASVNLNKHVGPQGKHVTGLVNSEGTDIETLYHRQILPVIDMKLAIGHYGGVGYFYEFNA